MLRLLTIVLILVLTGGVIGWWFLRGSNGQGPQYRTMQAERGPLVATIGATGVIQPEEIIDVGTQAAGRIERFGPDPRYRGYPELALAAGCLPLPGLAANLAILSPVLPKSIDYGSPVEEGTVLAQIDPSLYQTRVDKAKADLDKAYADRGQFQAKLSQAEREWNRVQSLSGTKAVSPSDIDKARLDYDSALASLDEGRAAIAQAQAAHKEAKINLGYTTIVSPVKGVIVDRRVNIGQTVVSSLNAPSLFLIAKDLKRLQVWASVNEADIGQVRPGQLVYFTVDAYPNEVFKGYVVKDQPRLNASMTQNVVTYTVVVSTDNSDLRLIPYLTANLQFVVQEKSEVLHVPNAALRWKPKTALIHPDYRAAYLKGAAQKRDTTGTAKLLGGERMDRGTVWVQEDGFVRPFRVRTGLTDGVVTEILEGEITAGMDLVAGEARQEIGGGGGANPFVPSTFGGKKKD